MCDVAPEVTLVTRGSSKLPRSSHDPPPWPTSPILSPFWTGRKPLIQKNVVGGHTPHRNTCWWRQPIFPLWETLPWAGFRPNRQENVFRKQRAELSPENVWFLLVGRMFFCSAEWVLLIFILLICINFKLGVFILEGFAGKIKDFLDKNYGFC